MEGTEPGRLAPGPLTGPGVSAVAPSHRSPTAPSIKVAVTLVLLALGLVVRLHGLGQEPLTFHPTRQYRSALIARAYYLDRTTSATDANRLVADQAAAGQGRLELPVMEEFVATAYQIAGGEHLWLARLLSSLIWVIGGLGALAILRRITDFVGAIVGVGVYLLLPLGVEGGRSFQPDSLMVVAMVVSVVALLRYDERPTVRRLTQAGLMSGFAMLIKPMAIPVVLATFVGLQLYRGGLRALISWRVALYSFVALGPALAFYVDGVYVAGFLRGQSDSSFIPALLGRGYFYRDWLRIVDVTIGWPLVAVAATAIVLVRGRDRVVLVAVWTGYFVFGLAFDYRTATHTYYHLQLVPIVAIGAGVVAARVASWIRTSGFGPPLRAAGALAGGVLAIALVRAAVLATPSLPAQQRAEVARDRVIGDATGHTRHAVFVSESYGAAEEYYGSIVGAEFPSPSDVALAKLQHRQVGGVATYLSSAQWLVVTSWDEWMGESDLRSYVTQRFRLTVSGPRWLVYDLRAATP